MNSAIKFYYIQAIDEVWDWVLKEVERIKKITDPSQQYEKAKKAVSEVEWKWKTKVKSFYDSHKHKGLRYDSIDDEFHSRGSHRWNTSPYKQLTKLRDDALSKMNSQREEKKPSERQKKTYSRYRCNQCNKKSLFWHYIYDKNTGSLWQSSFNAGEGQLVFCETWCFSKWKRENEKKDQEKFQEKNNIQTYKRKCNQCNKNFEYSTDKWNWWYYTDKKNFCSENCYYIDRAPSCDKCSEKCVRHPRQNAWGVTKEIWYYDSQQFGKLCAKCTQDKDMYKHDEERDWRCPKCEKVTKYDDWYVYRDNDGTIKGTCSYCEPFSYGEKNQPGNAQEKKKGMLDLTSTINCSHCKQSITAEYCWHDEEKNDGKEFCSQQCAEGYYSVSDLNDNNNSIYDDNSSLSIEKRERDNNLTQQQQLLSEIMQLEQNNPNNQEELNSKKQKLKDLQSKEKELTKSLPLSTQISLLEREIKELENKSNKSQADQSLLESKKKQLEELLKKQNNATETKPSDKTGLYIGCGIVGIFLLLGLFILVRKTRKRPIQA